MEIPHTALAVTTLRNLVEEFVTREGTDYGTRDFSLEDKVAHVMSQIQKGAAVIVYDESSKTCHIETKEQMRKKQEVVSSER